MAERIVSFEAFYPWYLNEHRVPACRWLHFAGTTSFVATVLAALASRPLAVGAAIAYVFAAGWLFFGMESRRSAAPVLLSMILVAGLAHPGILGGVVGAYACAWIGHFVIEKNRPATFTYPLWSLAGDFRMWSEMVRGRRWSEEPAA